MDDSVYYGGVSLIFLLYILSCISIHIELECKYLRNEMKTPIFEKI